MNYSGSAAPTHPVALYVERCFNANKISVSLAPIDSPSKFHLFIVWWLDGVSQIQLVHCAVAAHNIYLRQLSDKMWKNPFSFVVSPLTFSILSLERSLSISCLPIDWWITQVFCILCPQLFHYSISLATCLYDPLQSFIDLTSFRILSILNHS